MSVTDRIPPPPRKPEECKRHRWSPLIDLRTGNATGGAACWHCGTVEPKVENDRSKATCSHWPNPCPVDDE